MYRLLKTVYLWWEWAAATVNRTAVTEFLISPKMDQKCSHLVNS